MRRTTVRSLFVLAMGGFLLLALQPVPAQEKAAKPSAAKKSQKGGPVSKGSQPQEKTPPKTESAQLAEMLAVALKHNPDIRVAEAKLREAEAELNRTRLDVWRDAAIKTTSRIRYHATNQAR